MLDDTTPTGTSTPTSTRRQLIVAGGLTAMSGLAGCTAIDFVRGEEPTEFAAEPATVADAALAGTGYELHETDEIGHTETFEAAGQRREVHVTTRLAEYDRGVDLFGTRFQAAVFTAISTPQVRVLGRTFNPIGEMTSEELAEAVQDRYEDVHDIEQRSEYTTAVLGEEVRIVQYDAEAELAEGGPTVDVTLHVSDPVEAGDDIVVGFAAYPRIVGDGDDVRTLFNNVEHPAVD